MGMIIARRKAEEFSPFKFFFKTLIKVCDPDEVWISSGYYYYNFWNTNDRPGDMLKDLLSDKTVVLVGDQKTYNIDIQRLKNALLHDLRRADVRAFVLDKPDSYLRSNEIQLYKNGSRIAGIVGSSNCATRDLEFQRRNDGTSFDIKTDMIYFDPSFDNDIIIAMGSPDPELRIASHDQISIDIFGIDRKDRALETDIIRNTDLKTFVTDSGFFSVI